jgi:hypothetical protein
LGWKVDGHHSVERWQGVVGRLGSLDLDGGELHQWVAVESNLRDVVGLVLADCEDCEVIVMSQL